MVFISVRVRRLGATDSARADNLSIDKVPYLKEYQEWQFRYISYPQMEVKITKFFSNQVMENYEQRATEVVHECEHGRLVIKLKAINNQ